MRKFAVAIALMLLVGCAGSPIYKNENGALFINTEHDEVIDLQTQNMGEYIYRNGQVYFDVGYMVNKNEEGYFIKGFYAFNDFRDSKAYFTNEAKLIAGVSNGTSALREIKADCTGTDRRCDFQFQVGSDFRYVYLLPSAAYKYYRYQDKKGPT